MGVVRPDSYAPAHSTRIVPDRRLSSESRSVYGEFIRRGGEWWRLWNPLAEGVIVGLLSVHEPVR